MTFQNQTSHHSKLVMNVAVAELSKPTIQVGTLPFVSKEQYRDLRNKHWNTHAFRSTSADNIISNVAIQQDEKPIGKISEVQANHYLLLIARAIQKSILVWLAGNRPILKANKNILFWGEKDSAKLLSRALSRLDLKSQNGLEEHIKYDIDCRLFRDQQENSYLGVVVEVGTAYRIDISVADLIKAGLDIKGRYVCQKQETDHDYLYPRLELLGKVTNVSGDGKLTLADAAGHGLVNASEVYIEPRHENYELVLQTFYPQNVNRILENLESLRRSFSHAKSKLSKIKETLGGLRARKITLGDGLEVSFAQLIDTANERFPTRITTDRPTFYFGSQGRNQGDYPDRGITNYGPYMYMQHSRNEPLVAVVCEANARGAVEQFIEALRNGYNNDLWKNEKRQNPFPVGLIGKFRLNQVRFIYEECKNITPSAYRDAIRRVLNNNPDHVPDIAIVQTRDSFNGLFGSNNPYFIAKSEFMSAGVPVQAIEIENIRNFNDSLAYLLNNIALAIYAKLDGIPWVIATPAVTTHELVMGLGYSEVSRGRLGERKRFVGITSVFQGDGRYLVWDMTSEVEFENYAEALLSNLQSTIKYVKAQNAWQAGDKVRLVCHVYKRLKNQEVDAIKSLVKKLIDEKYQVEFAFLDISWTHPYQIFEPSNSGVRYWSQDERQYNTKGEGVPNRGLCLQLDSRRALIQLAGARELKTKNQGVPKPLLVELHPDSDFTDLTYLMRQIYHFSYMSWRSFFPSTEPVTIYYSRLIAVLLGNLNTVDGWNSNILVGGSLRSRRWFL